MTKTYSTVVSHLFATPGLPEMMPLYPTMGEPLVWNLDHCNLFVIWLLMIGIFIEQSSRNQPTDCFNERALALQL
jgi:hypothetical protein